MKDPDEQPEDDFNQLFWETYEEMWTKDENGDHIAYIHLPVEVRDAITAYAKERGLDPMDLLGLAIDRDFIKPAISRWGEKVAALVDDPDLFDWPLDDPLSCIAIGMMRHLATGSIKKWRERHGDDDEPADWWKSVE